MVIKGKATIKYRNGTSTSAKGMQSIPDTDSICSIEGGGSIELKHLSVDDFKFNGHVDCTSIVANSNLKISGAVSANYLKAGGKMSIIFSDNIIIDEINATSFEIKPIDIKDINNKSPILNKLLGLFIENTKNIVAKVNKIKASNVELIGCNVGSIICDNIKISGHCNIGQLICHGKTIIIGEDVIIKKQHKND